MWGTSKPVRVGLVLFALVAAGWHGSAAEPTPGDEIEDVTTLAAFNVKADRFEEFGFRVTGQLAIPGTSYAMIAEVFPNTAASKAGLRPSELITKVDGKRRSIFALIGLAKTQDRKWAALAAGKTNVTWSFGVHAPGSKDRRVVTMTIPSPAPHWGSKTWTAPEGRVPAEVKEPGPLSDRARDVLDNGIWSVLRAETFFGVQPRYLAPVLGYEWRIVQPSATHRIWVTQQRGRTEIIREQKSPALGHSLFLTSPSGALEKASCRPAKKAKQDATLSDEEVRSRFEAELVFWLTQVGRVSGRWPFEPLSGQAEDIAILGKQAAETAAAPSESFLKLPRADDAQRALFSDALGKVGMDEDRWAYTEAARAFGDELETTVRVDPSQPPAQRTVLVGVDGKRPKSAHLQRWRDESRSAEAILGELPGGRAWWM